MKEDCAPLGEAIERVLARILDRLARTGGPEERESWDRVRRPDPAPTDDLVGDEPARQGGE